MVNRRHHDLWRNVRLAGLRGNMRQNGRSRKLLGCESLELRKLLAADPIISEFMASNDDVLLDSDGQASDWIEIHNQGDMSVDLAGYRLTDTPDDPLRWVFPSVTLDADDYLVVFASGQNTSDYVDAGGNLHTTFRLNADNDYVALLSPEGAVLSEFGAGGTMFPTQLTNISYGVSSGQTTNLVDANSPAEYIVPLGGPNGTGWTEQGFDANAAGFSSGFAAIGYETVPKSGTSFSGEILTQIPEGNHAVFVRIPFQVDDIAAVEQLTLGMKFDNGFVAYLNGVKVAQGNAPDNADWATFLDSAGPSDGEALEYVDFNLTGSVDLLVEGENILAVHGLNYIAGDISDMLISPQMRAAIATGQSQAGFFLEPTPGATNGDPAAGLVSFSRDGGIVSGETVVELTPPNETATIRYTIDGSDPTAASTEYIGPIAVSNSQQIRARAFEDGLEPGPITQTNFIGLADDVKEFSSNLPIVIVDSYGTRLTTAGDPRETFSVVVDVDQQTDRATITGEADYTGRAGMRVRGRSSAGFSKKQYKFETQDEYGNDRNVSLLGMPSESDWVLHAPYTDKSLMRNFITYRMWEELGYWSPRTQFVEVFLNIDGDDQVSYDDDYVGVYVLMEGIKAGDDRIDVTPPEDSENLEEITGGFLLELGNADSANNFTTTGSPQSMAHYFHDPRKAELTTVQRQWMEEYVEAFETALYSDTFADPETGAHFFDYIDVDSFVDFEIMRQFLKNFDGGSTYYSIERGEKLQMGPLWDYNWALGNVNYAEGGDIPGYRTDGWNLSYTGNLNGWPHWWRRLDQDTEYWQRFIDRWTELRQGMLADESYLADIDSNAALISAESADRNFERWNVLGRFTNISPPGFRDRDTYQKEVDYLKEWLVERGAWMDSRFVAAPSLTPVELEPERITLVDADSPAQYIVPLGGPNGMAWTELGFDASGANFSDGFAAIGYEDNPGSSTSFADEILTTIASGNHAVFSRISFAVEDAAAITELALRIKYDNGFVAYLNGVKVAYSNAPDNADWTTFVDSPGQSDGHALEYTEFDLSGSAGLLVDGENILAIHGLNYIGGDISDMLISPQLEASIPVDVLDDPGDPPKGQVPLYATAGNIYYTVDGTDPRLPGGGISPSAILYDGPVSLVEPQVLMARVRADDQSVQPVTTQVRGRQDLIDNGKYDGSPWSAPTIINSVAPVPLNEALRITEINYNPGNPTEAELTAGYTDADDFEFVELMNISDQTIDLSDAHFDKVTVGEEQQGLDFDFSDSSQTQLAPNQRVVVVEDMEAFGFRYGNAIPVAGQWSGGLGNAGETILLADGETVIHLFAYDDAWYPATDGNGSSLEIKDANDPELDNWAQQASWQASATSGGTPGASAQRNGDFNNDKQVDAADIDLVQAEILAASNNIAFDLNGDSVVNQQDLDALVRNILGTEYGDTDLDGDVDFTDFNALANHFGQAGGWAEGNFDGDDEVAFADFNLLANGFGFPAISAEAATNSGNPDVKTGQRARVRRFEVDDRRGEVDEPKQREVKKHRHRHNIRAPHTRDRAVRTEHFFRRRHRLFQSPVRLRRIHDAVFSEGPIDDDFLR